MMTQYIDKHFCFACFAFPQMNTYIYRLCRPQAGQNLYDHVIISRLSSMIVKENPKLFVGCGSQSETNRHFTVYKKPEVDKD